MASKGAVSYTELLEMPIAEVALVAEGVANTLAKMYPDLR